jgi:hypothetical protein
MWLILSGWFRKLQSRFYKRSIEGALALHRRNEVRSDGLTLESVCNRLEICWHARNVHPWDSVLSPEYQESAFNQQAMEDTEAAVRRIFERRPEVEVIEVTVLDPHSSALLASGTVRRSALNALRLRAPSVRMRLGELGIRYFWGPGDEGTYRAEARGEPSGKLDHTRIA